MDSQERNIQYNPTQRIFAELHAVNRQVEALFSPNTHDVYKAWEIMVGRHGPARSANEFVDAQQAALRAMYKEAGFIE